MSHIVWLLGWGTRFDSQWGQELIITLLEQCANPYTNTVVHTSHYISLPLRLYYGAEMAGHSIPAAEHRSVITYYSVGTSVEI